MYKWRSEDNIQEFYHVGPGDETQVIRFGIKHLYLLSHPSLQLSSGLSEDTGPHLLFRPKKEVIKRVNSPHACLKEGKPRSYQNLTSQDPFQQHL